MKLFVWWFSLSFCSLWNPWPRHRRMRRWHSSCWPGCLTIVKRQNQWMICVVGLYVFVLGSYVIRYDYIQIHIQYLMMFVRIWFVIHDSNRSMYATCDVGSIFFLPMGPRLMACCRRWLLSWWNALASASLFAKWQGDPDGESMGWGKNITRKHDETLWNIMKHYKHCSNNKRGIVMCFFSSK